MTRVQARTKGETAGKAKSAGPPPPPVRERGAYLYRFALVRRIETGLDVVVVVVDELARDLELPALAVRKLAKISSSTFNRRQKAGVLSAEESDRVYRLRLILEATGGSPGVRRPSWRCRARSCTRTKTTS